MNTVKLTIAELRKNKGVTQSELADFLGVSFQSISKWENGITMPDILLLPKISEYFKVSIDEILGLKPLKNREYKSRRTDSKEHWNKQLNYLKNSRVEFWNYDYLEFLVKNVWNITKPIKIIDFGCGYGYLGMMLLPILPTGSVYTGIDISDELIDEAKLFFKDSDYSVEFIKSDINTFDVKEKYDMAICQALLRHLPNPKDILKKMIDSVSCGGLVVCIEVNREFENTGLYIHGMDYSLGNKTSTMQKLWKTELELEGRDYSIGMKIPFYMQEYGLKNIDVRLNDKVNFINPYGNKDRYNKLIDSLIKANNWDIELSDDRKENIIKLFMNRGLTRSEAEIYIQSELGIRNYFMDNLENALALRTLCLLISYGTKGQ
ncbi:methyltransferase domain-containing protein [Tissierella pigra]|uniref:helix-turn-helix domain-containing protein n=1 Tax=Tissierella pigra TaxID=2607614 RepID=UPI001C10E9CE|nr:methyltransferase domain-containing protein [Tissierella pigra]MBU5427615.1 methyltransferase domain-containing protein [Tissierella pigra]